MGLCQSETAAAREQERDLVLDGHTDFAFPLVFLGPSPISLLEWCIESRD